MAIYKQVFNKSDNNTLFSTICTFHLFTTSTVYSVYYKQAVKIENVISYSNVFNLQISD